MDPFRPPRGGVRRGSEHTVPDLQYYTPRGVIPAQIVDAQAAAIPDIAGVRRGRYPHRFWNDEEELPGGRRGRLFDPDVELKEGEQLWEFPVIPPGRPPFNMDRAPTGLNRMRQLRHRTARDIFANPPNDPGPFRGVVPAIPGRGADPDGRRPPIGLIYHPEGNAEGFARAPLEPLDQEGRRLLRRHEDDLAMRPLGRTGTWPPRDEEAEDLATYEIRHEIAPRERRRYLGPLPRR